MSCYVYNDKNIDKAIKLCLNNSYALTGSVFSSDKKFINYFNYHLINLSKLFILFFSFNKITRFIIKTHEIPTNKLSLNP